MNLKKLLTIIFVLLASFVKAQVYTPMTAAGNQFKRIMADSTLHIPSFCGLPVLRDVSVKKAAIAVDSCNHLFYFYDPKLLTWSVISGGGSVGDSIISLAKNFANDSIILLLKDGRRFAVDFPATGTSKFYDSTSVNFDSTKYVYFNGSIPVDSVSIRSATNLATTNLQQTGTNRTYNGRGGTLGFSNFNYLQFLGGTGNAGSLRLDAAAINLSHTSSILLNSPGINIPTLSQDNALTKILVKDNSFSGKLYWRDVSSISTAEADPLFDTKFAAKTTTNLAEGSNLYYTTVRARAAISLITAGTTGPASYNSITGVINVPEYSAGIVAETDPLSFHLSDTANKWVNNVTKINDSTIRVFKGAGNTDLLIRGNGSGSGGIAMVKQNHLSGSTVTVNNTTTWLIDKSASDVTITLSASPVDGQRVDISFKLAVTLVTVSPNSGQTVKDANGITDVEAGESIAYQYDATDLIWYRL